MHIKHPFTLGNQTFILETGELPRQAAGIRIVLRSLEEPLRQIAANAGAHAPVVMNTVLDGDGDADFYDADDSPGDAR